MSSKHANTEPGEPRRTADAPSPDGTPTPKPTGEDAEALRRHLRSWDRRHPPASDEHWSPTLPFERPR